MDHQPPAVAAPDSSADGRPAREASISLDGVAPLIRTRLASAGAVAVVPLGDGDHSVSSDGSITVTPGLLSVVQKAVAESGRACLSDILLAPTDYHAVYRGAGVRSFIAMTVPSHPQAVLVALDDRPRTWSDAEWSSLEELGRQVGAVIGDRCAYDLHFHDLVERARAHAFDLLFDAVVVTDLAGCIVDWNVGSERLYGYAREEVIGRPVNILHAVEDRERVTEEMMSGIRRDGRWSGEIRMTHRDGHTGWIESIVVPVYDDGGVLRGALGINRDISDRMRSEEALRQSETRTRLIIEMAYDAFVAVDQGGTIVDWNAQAERTLGWSRDEVIGRDMVDNLVPERYRSQYRDEMAIFIETGHSDRLNRRLEVLAVHRRGREIPVEVTISPIRTGDGWLFSAFLHDITERKRNEAALLLSEERYRLVSRATNDVIRDWNIASGEITWNEAASRVFRCPPDAVGRPIEWWYERIHPEDRESIVTGLQTVIEGVGGSWSEEYRFRRGDGSYATILDRAYVVRADNGAPLRLVSSMLDITERRRVERTQRFLADASTLLDSSLDYHATLLSLARLAVPDLADYCLIDVLEPETRELRRVAAIHRDPMKQRHLRQDERVPIDADASHHPVLSVFLSGEAVLVPECDDAVLKRIGHDEHHRRSLQAVGLRSFIIVPLASQARTLGTITFAQSESGRRYSPVDLVVAQNLAGRAGVAVDNALLYQRSREAVKARDEILAIVSHDLRNPINTIKISADMALETTPPDAACRRPLEIIQRSSGEMNGLIQDLLDTARLDAGQLSLARRITSIDRLLVEVSESFAVTAARDAIEVRLVQGEGLPELWVDAGRIRQLLSNLIGNAIKFTPRHGRVEIVAAASAEAVRVDVRDTGPGIPPEHIPHVFDRYWQARRGGRQGAGLGLAISKGIVTAHGGEIWVESTEGQGSTFSFTLPRAAGPEV